MEEVDVAIVEFACTQAEAVSGLQRVFGIDQAAALKLVTRVPCTVKRGLNEQEAAAYVAILEGLRAIVRCSPSAAPEFAAGPDHRSLPPPPVDSRVDVAAIPKAPKMPSLSDIPKPRDSLRVDNPPADWVVHNSVSPEGLRKLSERSDGPRPERVDLRSPLPIRASQRPPEEPSEQREQREQPRVGMSPASINPARVAAAQGSGTRWWLWVTVLLVGGLFAARWLGLP